MSKLNNPEYDLLIVGAGLFGASVARLCTDRGLKCLVIEKRCNIGGNCRDKLIEDINVHLFGPHIFHTSNRDVWDFACRFSDFNHFRYCPLANFEGQLYNLPFNMHTFYQLYCMSSPIEVAKFLESIHYNGKPSNLEEKAVSLVGDKIYNILIKGYTEKQWGKDCRELSPDIITRLPVRLTFDNNYFDDIYQGIPIGGYSKWINNILNGIQVMTDTDFLTAREFWKSKAEIIIYTGSIDEFFGYEFGCLEYRSLYWKHILYEHPNRQGVAVINYTSKNIPYTRSIEHKHFEFGNQPVTILSEEYPQHWQIGEERFYPVNNPNNDKLYSKYTDLASGKMPYVIFGGILGTYSYFDMDDTIAEAISTADRICHKLINR